MPKKKMNTPQRYFLLNNFNDHWSDEPGEGLESKDHVHPKKGYQYAKGRKMAAKYLRWTRKFSLAQKVVQPGTAWVLTSRDNGTEWLIFIPGKRMKDFGTPGCKEWLLQ